MINPLTDPYLILDKVYCEGQFLKQAINSVPLEPSGKSRTVKICYGVLDNDIYLDYIIRFNCKETPRRSVRIIIKIALYMLEFIGKKDYAVVDNAVTLCKKLGKTGASGFVNAFLRSYKVPPLPPYGEEYLSVKYSYPLWLVKKLKRSYKGEAEKIMAAKSPGQCVRFVRGEEKFLNLPHMETPFKGVYIFENFAREDGFLNGDYTFQSVGSVAICAAISPVERILDACAAPGGKSVLLAEKCGFVTSCELHAHRVKLIEDYFKRMGTRNAAAVCADSAAFNPDYEGKFGAVLCDVPCSGTGVIAENPDIKLNRKEGDIPSLNKVQSAILNNCAKYVKEGGTLYYSTCSVLPEENDSVAYTFLRQNPDFVLVKPASPLEHLTTKYGLQFLPHMSLGAGFYLTAFNKLSPSKL